MIEYLSQAIIFPMQENKWSISIKKVNFMKKASICVAGRRFLPGRTKTTGLNSAEPLNGGTSRILNTSLA